MSTQVASLIATITADSSGLKRGLDQAKTSLQTTAKEMTTFGGSMGSTIKQFATMAVVGGAAYKAVGAVGDFMKDSVNDTMDYAKAIRDVSRYTGMSADQSSIMLQIADDLQIEMGSLKTGFRNLNKEGIQPNIENIKMLAAEYQSIVDPVDKARFATEKFGARAGQELSKMLELTADEIDNIAQSAEDLGLVLDSTAIAATEEYRLSVDQLNDAYKGLQTTIGMAIIPQAADLATGAGDLVVAYKLAQKGIEQGKYSVVDFFKTWMTMSSQAEIDQYINDMRDAFSGAAVTTDDFAGRAGAAANAMAEMSGEIGGATTKVLGLIGAYGNLSFEFDPLTAAQKLFNEGLQKGAEDLVDLQQNTLNAAAASGNYTEAQLAGAMAQQENLRNIRDLNAAYEAGQVNQGDYYRMMKDGYVTNEELNKQIGVTESNLTELQRATGISAEQWAEYAAQNAAATGAMSDATSAVSGVTGAIDGISGAANSAVGAIDGIAASINGLPKETTLTIKVNYITTGTGGGSWKTGGGIWEERQSGGPVWSGHPYVVGEAGPEIFVPNVSGKVIPNRAGMSGGMGGDTINIYNNSAGAAALTMAILAQQKRMRLQRSMGG